MSDDRDEKGRLKQGNKAASYSDEEMEKFLAQYIAYRSHGYDKEGFALCDYRTVERWAKQHPERRAELKKAEARGWRIWEDVLMNVATGQQAERPPQKAGGEKITIDPESCNPILLMFLIKNKLRKQYGDKQEATLKTKGKKGAGGAAASTPFQIIDPDHGDLMDLNIGADPAQKKDETNS